MPRLLTTSFLARAAAVLALAAVIVAGALPHASVAAGSKQLQHVRGTIGYQTVAAGTDFKPVFGKFDLPDDDFAATHDQSAAVLALPDSSLVSLGSNTTVQVGAFDSASASPGSTITVNGGALRFDIRRPKGGTANYHFLTNTSSVAVRGTIGLLSFVNGVTTVGCVVCAADSVTVTAGGQTVSLLTGQFITISATGAITTGALTAVTGTFTAAGVPTSAQATAAAAGLPSGEIAGMSAGTATAVGAGAAVAGTAIGIAASQPTAKPQASSTNGSFSTSSPNPTPSPSSSGQPGNVNLNALPAPNSVRAPQAVPAPPAAPGSGPRTGR